MTAPPELRIGLDEVAAALDLHPFDVARILGHRGELPPGLRFTREDVERVRELAGIERWWSGGSGLPSEERARAAAMVQQLSRLLLRHDLTGARTTRADNLLRGLDPADKKRLRRVINALIRAGVLRTRASWRGLQVGVDRTWVGGLRKLADGAPIDQILPADALRAGRAR